MLDKLIVGQSVGDLGKRDLGDKPELAPGTISSDTAAPPSTCLRSRTAVFRPPFCRYADWVNHNRRILEMKLLRNWCGQIHEMRYIRFGVYLQQ